MKNNKNYDFLSELAKADDEMIEEIAISCPVLSEKEKQRIAEICEEKLAMKEQKNDLRMADEVGGEVDVISRIPWYRSRWASIAAAFVLIAGVGTAAMVNIGIGTEPSTSVEISEESEEEVTEDPGVTAEAEPVPVHFDISLPEDVIGKYKFLFTLEKNDNTLEQSESVTFICPETGNLEYDIDTTDCRTLNIKLLNLSNDVRTTVKQFICEDGDYELSEETIRRAFEAVDGIGSEEEINAEVNSAINVSCKLPKEAEGRFKLIFKVKNGDGTVDISETPVFWCPDSEEISQELDVSDGESLVIELENVDTEKSIHVIEYINLSRDIVFTSSIADAMGKIDGITAE